MVAHRTHCVGDDLDLEIGHFCVDVEGGGAITLMRGYRIGMKYGVLRNYVDQRQSICQRMDTD